MFFHAINGLVIGAISWVLSFSLPFATNANVKDTDDDKSETNNVQYCDLLSIGGVEECHNKENGGGRVL